MLKKINTKNLNLYICIAILCIFTIFYFVSANNISHAFETDNKLEIYNHKIFLIEKGAKNYAENNMDLFNEEESIYVSVSELASLGFIAVDDEENNVTDPRSEVKTLNDVKIKITYKNDKLSTKVIEG